MLYEVITGHHVVDDRAEHEAAAEQAEEQLARDAALGARQGGDVLLAADAVHGGAHGRSDRAQDP